MNKNAPATGTALDHTADTSDIDPFVDYYEEQSITPQAIQRFRRIKDLMLRVRERSGGDLTNLKVADIGCNTGTQCITWCEAGHRAFGLDINKELLAIARERCAKAGIEVSLSLGSATDIPWADSSMDVCLMAELLEHVEDWRSCLKEAARILRPGGVLYLSTTNKLCPSQMEFDLPLYSWYPGPIKRRYEELAVTSRPELVNHAKFPAVNWFTPSGLIRHLDGLGMDAFDHFDFVNESEKGAASRLALRVIRSFALVRFMAYVATPYSMIVGVKR